MQRMAFEAAIHRGGVGVKAKHRGVRRGLCRGRRRAAAGQGRAARRSAARLRRAGAADGRSRQPMPSRRGCSCAPGLERLADYQDAAYAREYLDRLKPIAEIDKRHGNGSGNLLAETARELALGMAYEDTVRVAELKIRPSRFERVRAEVQAADGQIVEIAEFLHPRVQEIADTLPAGLGRWLLEHRLGAALRRALHQGRPRGEDLDHPRLPADVFHRRAEADAAALAALRQRAEVPARMARAPSRSSPRPTIALATEIATTRTLVKGYSDTHERGTRDVRHADADAAADHGDARPGGDAGARCARPRSPTIPARRSTPRSGICARCRRRRSSYGTTAVASISSRASGSNSRPTCTSAIAGK